MRQRDEMMCRFKRCLQRNLCSCSVVLPTFADEEKDCFTQGAMKTVLIGLILFSIGR